MSERRFRVGVSRPAGLFSEGEPLVRLWNGDVREETYGWCMQVCGPVF
jgi:hypothetical protein